MPERTWQGQFNIIAGQAQQDGPYADAITNRSAAESSADLFVTLQPMRTDTDQLCGEVVQTISRIFGRAQYSITGNLLLALGKAHQHLREWNRASLAEHRNSIGVSCAVIVGDDGYLAQAGESAAFLRHNGLVQRFEPLEKEARAPLGSLAEGQSLSPWFHSFKLEQGDTLLLLSGNLAARLDTPSIDGCLVLEPDDALAALFRLARPDQDCGAVLVRILENLAIEPDDEGDEEQPLSIARRRSTTAMIESLRSRRHDDIDQPLSEPPLRPDRTGRRPPSPLGRSGIDPARMAHPDAGKGVLRVFGYEIPRAPFSGPAHALPTADAVLAAAQEMPRTSLRVRADHPGFRNAFHRLDSGRRSTKPFVGGGVAVIAIALVFWFGLPALMNTGRTQRFQTLVQSAQTEITSAQTEVDLSKRRELLNQAVSNIDEARRLKPQDQAVQGESATAQDALSVLDAVYTLPDVPVLADLAAAGLSPSSAVEVAAGDRYYVLDFAAGKVFAAPRDGSGPPEVVYEDGSDIDGVHAGKAHHIAWQTPESAGASGTLLILDAGRHLFGLSRNDLRAIPLRGVEQWRQDTAMALSGTTLYVLDAPAGLVWRYAGSAAGFDNDPAPAVARQDIRDASGISVVSGIFLTGQDTRIRRFLDGQETSFKLAGIDKQPAAPQAPLYDPATSSLYISDRGNSRIVVLEGDGRFKRQLVNARLAGLRGTAVDTGQGRLVGVIGQALVAIPLPK